VSSSVQSAAIPQGDWDVDVAVIGAGPGGEDCARELAAGRLRVALVNDAPLPGGECLWRGCIPSKTWRAAADRLRERAEDARLGVMGTEGVSLDWAALERFRRELILERAELALKTDLKAKIDYRHARARFTGPHGLELTAPDGGRSVLSFGAAVIATGAPAFVPPIPGAREGLADGSVLTSETGWDLPERPSRLAIVGAGVIGLEMALIFADFGSEVTVLEILDRVLPEMEGEIARRLAERLSTHPRLALHTSVRVSAVEGRPGAVTLRYEDASGAERRLEVERVLMATGKRPALDGLGLEAAGVAVERGAVVVDAGCRTKVPHIYAVGDVIGGLMLAHTASAQGRVAAGNLLGGAAEYREELDGGVVFTRPQAATAGLSLEQAKARGLDAVEMKYPTDLDVVSRLHFEEGGLFKLVAEKAGGRVLGAQVLADQAQALIGEAVALVASGATLGELSEAIHPHPTQTEIWGEMARRLKARLDRERTRRG